MIKLHGYNLNDLLIRMLENPDVSKEEIIDFVRSCAFVAPEKASDFIMETSEKYPDTYYTDKWWRDDPIDPVSEGIVPLGFDDD